MSDLGTRHTILVVEDDLDIAQSLRDVLEAEGYAVVTASNGKEALERLRGMERPSLIFLDLMMPVMSGGEFLGVLRQTEPFKAIPVVIVSAWPKEAAQVRAQSEGYVKKPVSLEALLDAAHQFCPVGKRAEPPS
jgi:CheY-like chemotaxis protein